MCLKVIVLTSAFWRKSVPLAPASSFHERVSYFCSPQAFVLIYSCRVFTSPPPPPVGPNEDRTQEEMMKKANIKRELSVPSKDDSCLQGLGNEKGEGRGSTVSYGQDGGRGTCLLFFLSWSKSNFIHLESEGSRKRNGSSQLETVEDGSANRQWREGPLSNCHLNLPVPRRLSPPPQSSQRTFVRIGNATIWPACYFTLRLFAPNLSGPARSIPNRTSAPRRHVALQNCW